MSEVEKQDVDKTKALIKSLDDLVEVGEDVFADGKVDFADLTSAPAMVKVLQGLYEAWQNKNEIVAELKDVDIAEIKQLLDEAFDG